ncbi:uncharacterized protein LOC142992444 [Genypterus blacodes]|uniref:uncharacterized protein LOC142992444 n=1 Tax=Genypterus blacodes TaxID=154954 RepID=UPI003F76B296
MALSQVQCLDDNHVNLRTHESKPEFLYCEEQRLALEVLLENGREAYHKYVEDRGLRGFLSDPELDLLIGAVKPYDPDSELLRANVYDDDEPPLSLHYWPDLSDTSIPLLDIGWPDSEAYRGVTRTTVYAQPPLDGQAHIKEVVRRMIAQAQKVIAVVMDIFTDVDIFRDLLDAGFRKKVSVYILVEHNTLPHFVSMCQRANMHAGHLKNLRVRSAWGEDFYTRSCSKVRGQMGHRFMFIDGDKAVSGSYSFTWMSSRLEKHLVTVVTGQAVNAFDRLFRSLYTTSSAVDLRQVVTSVEPEPQPLPPPVPVALPSAALARKLYNPKYALLAMGYNNPSPTPSSGLNGTKESSSQNPEVTATGKRQQRKTCLEAVKEVPPLHPGLVNLEKAYLISYLPIWPEPDPPSDVIGFINIRDANRPTHVHLQRHEMFETSQAIRFSSPVSVPQETLPEVAKPRKLTVEIKSKLQSLQAETKTEVAVVDRAHPAKLTTGPSDFNSQACAQEAHTCESEKESHLQEHGKPALNSPAIQDARNDTAPHLSAHKFQQLSKTASSVTNEETLPEIAKPMQFTVKREVEDSVVGRAQPTQLNAGLSDTKREEPEQEVHTSGAESEKEYNNMSHPKAPANQAATAKTSQQSNHKPPSVNTESERATPKPESCPVSKRAGQTEPDLNTHNDSVSRTYRALTSHLPSPPSSVEKQLNTEQQTKNVPQCTYLQTPAVQPQSSAEVTTALSSPLLTNHSCFSPSSASQTHAQPESTISLSENSPVHFPLSPVGSFSLNVPPSITTVPTPDLLSSSTLSPPVAKPRTFQLVIKDNNITNGVDLPKVSVISTRSLTGHKEPLRAAVVQTPLVPDTNLSTQDELEAVVELQNKSEIKSVVQNNSKSTRKPRKECFAPQQNLSSNSQKEEPICEKSFSLQHDTAGTQMITKATAKPQPQLDGLITDTSTASVTVQEVMLREVEPETFTLTENEITAKLEVECVVIAPRETEEARDIEALTVKEESNNVTQLKTYYATPNEPQKISYCDVTRNRDTLESVNSLEVATHSPGSSTLMQKHSLDSSADTHKHAADSVHPQPDHPSVTSALNAADGSQNTAEHNTHGTLQEPQQSLVTVLGSLHTPERPTSFHFTNPSTQTPELRSGMPEGESCPVTPFLMSDRFSQRTPTPDSQTHTPDARSYPQDLRTPTPDVSDGYVSTREDSNLSTTSDEYYECSDSSFHEPVFYGGASPAQGTPEDCVTFTHRNSTTTPSPSSQHINYSIGGATYSSSECSSDSETRSVEEYSVTTRVSSSYPTGEKDKMREEGETTNEENRREEDAERGNRTEEASPLCLEYNRIEGKGPSEFLQRLDKAKDSKQLPKRKGAVDLAGVENVISGGVKLGESNGDGSEPKGLSTYDSKPVNDQEDKVTSGGERLLEMAAQGPSVAHKTERSKTARDTEGQKLLRTPSKPPRGQQQQVSKRPSLSQPAQPSRPPRRAWRSPHQNQATNKELQNSIQPLDKTSTPHRQPSRPPPPRAVGRKQAEVSQNQQGSPSLQPPAGQGAGRPASQLALPKPQGSFLHTQMQSQLQSQSASSQNLTPVQTQGGVKQSSEAVGAVVVAQGQDEGRTHFGFPFSRLYSFKGLKDRMGKQSKRSSSPVQRPKSTG